MEGANMLIGGAFQVEPDSEAGMVAEEAATDPAAAEDGRGTEVVVAAFVLGALLLLVLFQVAGFRAVIGVSANVGS